MILMTRPARYERSFRAALKGTRVTILSCSLLDVEAVGDENLPTTDYDALIFTSPIAVAQSENRMRGRDLKCYAVGPGTASALVNAGFETVIDTGGTAEHMADYLDRARFDAGLYVSGQDVTCDLSLKFPGRVDRVIVYRTTPSQRLPDDVRLALERNESWIAPFFSKKSYDVFERMIVEEGLQSASRTGHAIAISGSVTRSSRLQWGGHTIANSPNAKGMYAAVRAAA